MRIFEDFEINILFSFHKCEWLSLPGTEDLVSWSSALSYSQPSGRGRVAVGAGIESLEDTACPSMYEEEQEAALWVSEGPASAKALQRGRP